MPLARLPDEDVPFVVGARGWCTPVVAQLVLRPVDGAIEFRAGQYVLVQDEGRTVPVRSYSVANAPRADGTLTLLVTAVPDGPTSTWLTSGARVDDRLLVSGPYGTFVADPTHHGPTLYLAGGSGLAPVLALVEEALARSDTDEQDAAGRHTVLFSGRTAADVIDEARLTDLAARHPALDYVRTLTRVLPGFAPPPLGRVPEVLPTLLPDLGSHVVYIAGSPGFVDACTRTVQRLGVHPGRLHTEEFYAEPVPWHGADSDDRTLTTELEETP